ncbi:MAG: 30S ribosomal protein S1 [Balneolaceae bacterium]
MTEDLKQEQETEKKEEQNPETSGKETSGPAQTGETGTETGESNQDKEEKEETAANAPLESEAGEAAENDAEATAPAVKEAPGEVPTFTGDLADEVYTFDQLQAASDDYSDDEFNQLASMYEDTLNEIEEKEIVTGIVVSVDEKYVVVDIGFKSEGIVPVNEFSNKIVENLRPGDEVEVFLDRVEDREGQLILSRRKADILQAWETIEKSHETGEVIEGFIQRRIKGGMVVDIFGIDAFLPGSQIDVRPVRDFDAYVGKTMEFQVVKLNMQAENVVVSHRALIESDLEEQREEILESIEAGQVLEGIVKNITDFGVFIDLGGVDGLLHITDLSWGRVEHPEEIVRLDQRMNVAVIDFDEKSKRVSLGLKQLQPHPWNAIHEKFPEGMRVQGRVVSIADYGAFIELEKGVEGLIHISEMSWTQHIKHPSQLVDKNDIIECVVLNINEDEKKISLGVKQLEKDPWEDLLERYPIGSRHKGTVRNLTNFGVFVELEPGIDGLIHVSDLSWTDKVEHPNEIVNKGQEIEIVVLAVDFDNRRITLGHKQVEDNPWEKYAENYGPGSKASGKISKITDKGLFVELELGVDSFLPKDRLKEPVEDLSESYSEGDEIEGFVVEFDEPSKTIELSQKEKDTSKPKAKTRKKPGKQTAVETGTPTLGEVSGLAEKLAEAEKEKKNDDEDESSEETS